MADWTQVGMFWVTIAIAAITLAAVAVNYVMLRALNDPNIIVYAHSDEARPQMIMVVIQNIGKGVAKDIGFTLSEPLPAHSSTGPLAPLASGPLINGIPMLAPGESRVFFWGMYLALKPVIGERVFTVTTRFNADLLGWFRSDRFEVVSLLEMASFDRCDAVDTDGARQTAEQVKRLADLVEAQQNE